MKIQKEILLRNLCSPRQQLHFPHAVRRLQCFEVHAIAVSSFPPVLSSVKVMLSFSFSTANSEQRNIFNTT